MVRHQHLRRIVFAAEAAHDGADLRAAFPDHTFVGTVPAINPKWLRQIGIRSVDAGEKRLVHQAGLEVFDMRYIDEMGMRHTMDQALMGLDENTHLHVSFDVDFLDPDFAPGVGTTVPGGPTYREAQLCMEMIADTGLLASLDLLSVSISGAVLRIEPGQWVELRNQQFGSIVVRLDRIDAVAAP